MKAVVLVGGLGTRLRPITNHVPKPMIPLANRPFLEYTFDLLKRHGIHDVILGSYYLPDFFRNYFGDGSKYGISIQYSLEEQPLGTAGAVRNCKPFLDNEPFLMFNGDILTDLNLSALIDHHRSSGALATISLGKVVDPTAYGVIDFETNHKIVRWREKPSWEEVSSRWVNLGAYVLEPEILEHIPTDRQVSIERETFPLIIAQYQGLFAYPSSAYWLDIGTAPKYLKAQRHILTEVVSTSIKGQRLEQNIWVGTNVSIDPNAAIKGPVVIGNNTTIDANTLIIGPAAIGDNVKIGADSFIEESTIGDGCVLGARSSIVATILGRNVTLHDDATLKEGCIVEDNYVVNAKQVYQDNTILSHE